MKWSSLSDKSEQSSLPDTEGRVRSQKPRVNNKTRSYDGSLYKGSSRLGLLITLCSICIWNLLVLILSLVVVGISAQWGWAGYVAGTIFLWLPFPTILTTVSALDLYKRCVHSLSPTRVVVTGSLSVPLAVIAVVLTASSRFIDDYYSPLSNIVPGFSGVLAIHYIIYLTFGVVATRREARKEAALDAEANLGEVYGPEPKPESIADAVEDALSVRVASILRSEISLAHGTAPPSYKTRSVLSRRYSDSSLGGLARSTRFSIAETSLLTGFEHRLAVCKHCHTTMTEEDEDDAAPSLMSASMYRASAELAVASTSDVHSQLAAGRPSLASHAQPDLQVVAAAEPTERDLAASTASSIAAPSRPESPLDQRPAIESVQEGQASAAEPRPSTSLDES